MFGALVAQAGYTDPDALIQQLVLLYDGSNISAQLDNNAGAALAARDAAASLLRIAKKPKQHVSDQGNSTAGHRRPNAQRT
ncbi:MAG: hypothetical protein QOH14_3691 [Pseudonocardiales bacterium]|nr:hypothetical protein [Pseudonocardiales bacterium]